MKRFRSQRAVFVPLVATILLGIVYVLFGLGIDSSTVKVAQADLRLKLDNICSELAWNAQSQEQSKNTFATFIAGVNSRKEVKFATITEATLVMPTMPDMTDDFNFKFEFSGSESAAGQANTSPMDCGTGVTCKFEVKASNLNSNNLSSKYPNGLINRPSHIGNVVACSAKAQVKTLMLGGMFNRVFNSSSADASDKWQSQEINVKSVWWVPVNAPVTPYQIAEPIRTSPALTIAVGTEMPTDSRDDRFKFQSKNLYAPGTSAGPDFLNDYDPLSKNIEETFFSVANPSSGNFPELDALTEEDLEQMLVACQNPAVLVRNTYLSVIAELASRHGQLRNMTEILHINPKHTGLDSPNQPAKIASFGHDIAKAQFQLPYVFYKSGAEKNGWLRPYDTSSAWNKHDAFIAAQLRVCYHLYGGDSGSGSGIKKYTRNFDFFANGDYTPQGFKTFEPKLRNNPYAGTNRTRWDQESCYNIQEGSAVPANAACAADNSNLRLLTGPEVLASLGTTQSCPIEESLPGSKSCLKDSPASLSPDYAGLLNYLNGPADGGLSLNAPGIYALPPNTEANPTEGTHYTAATNLLSHIFIATHVAPTDAQDANNINAERSSLQDYPKAHRPITIAFFPTNIDEYLKFTNFVVAFKLSHNGTANTNSAPNMIYNFSPYDLELGKTCGVTNCGLGEGQDNTCTYDPNTRVVTKNGTAQQDWEVFADYWKCMLTDTSYGIVALARDHFRYRILRRELKF